MTKVSVSVTVYNKNTHKEWHSNKYESVDFCNKLMKRLSNKITSSDVILWVDSVFL